MSEAELPPEPPKPDLEPAREAASKPRLKVVPAAPLTAAQTPQEDAKPQANGAGIDFARLSRESRCHDRARRAGVERHPAAADRPIPLQLFGERRRCGQAFGRIAEYWLADPQRAFEARNAISRISSPSGRIRCAACPAKPSAHRAGGAGDRRFAAPQWRESPRLRFPAPGPRDRDATGPMISSPAPRPTRDPRQGAILSAPDHRRAVALEFRRSPIPNCCVRP